MSHSYSLDHTIKGTNYDYGHKERGTISRMRDYATPKGWEEGWGGDPWDNFLIFVDSNQSVETSLHTLLSSSISFSLFILSITSPSSPLFFLF